MELLDDSRISEGLASLEDWEWLPEEAEIRRTVALTGFEEAIALVEAIARAAQEADHHPDIDIRFNRVVLHLTTHSAGGITRNDLEMAAAIDRLVAEAPTKS